MAPHSPYPGLPIAVESRAPLLPLTRPYAQLLSGHPQLPFATTGRTSLHSDLQPIPNSAQPTPPYILGKTFTPHLPGRAHRTRYAGLSSFVFTVLLIMLVGGSGAMYRYQTLNGGKRTQSMMDVVKGAYFERDIITPSPVPVSVSLAIPILEQRDTTPSTSGKAPQPSTSKSSSFRNGEDVRDPSAVRPDEGENDQPVDPDSGEPDDTTGDDNGSSSPSMVMDSTSASPTPDSAATARHTNPPSRRHWGSRVRRTHHHRERYRRYWKPAPKRM